MGIGFCILPILHPNPTPERPSGGHRPVVAVVILIPNKLFLKFDNSI